MALCVCYKFLGFYDWQYPKGWRQTINVKRHTIESPFKMKKGRRKRVVANCEWNGITFAVVQQIGWLESYKAIRMLSVDSMAALAAPLFSLYWQYFMRFKAIFLLLRHCVWLIFRPARLFLLPWTLHFAIKRWRATKQLTLSSESEETEREKGIFLIRFNNIILSVTRWNWANCLHCSTYSSVSNSNAGPRRKILLRTERGIKWY